MKIPFPVSLCSTVVVVVALFTSPAKAALQLVTALNPSLGAPGNGNGDSWAPIISPDGRFVLFASTADNLVAMSASNGIPKSFPPSINVYLRDRLNHTTTLVSVNLSGTGGGDGNSFPTAISTNGQFALFESAADNLTANDTNNVNNVFLRDTVNGITWLVSAATNGASGNSGSRGSTMTPDGRFVAFVSDASNLVTNDINAIADVFVRDMQFGTTTLVSTGAVNAITATFPFISSSEAPEISPDGRYVAFSSTATNLVSGVTSVGEIYVRDLVGGTTTWASTNAQNISKLNGTGLCYNQSISGNGQYVSYEICTNSPSATNGFVLRFNQQTGLTDIVSTNAAIPAGSLQDKRSLNMTPDGRFIAYAANYNAKSTCINLWDSQTGTNILASADFTNGVIPNAFAYWPDVDPSGRYVLFVSTDTNMISRGGTISGVFLRDMLAGTTTLVSVDTTGSNLTVNPTAVPVLTADGSAVAFESSWANLDGRNYESDVFVRNLTNAASELISAHDPGLPSVTPNSPVELWAGSISTNGRYMAFSSLASNLAPNDTNGCLDVFVRDLATGQNTLASVALNGFSGSGSSYEPSISGSGRYVAFTSAATNLVTGEANPFMDNPPADIFVRDLQTGMTKLVSITTNGGFALSACHSSSISADGRYVLFASLAPNLAFGTTTGDNLFLRDSQAGRTYAVTASGYQSYAMTPDGGNVAFIGSIGSGNNLYVWNTSAASWIYTNTSAGLTNVSISPDAHWLVYVAGTSLFAQDLIAGTNCQIATGPIGSRAGLGFSADGRFLTYAGTNDVFVYDFQGGTNLLVSHAYNSPSPANGISDSPVISADGRFVAFRSFASNCVAGDSNGFPDVFLYDSLSNSTILVSANLSGAAGDNHSLIPAFSGDGQTLAFQSWASDLTSLDFNLGSDLLALNVFSIAAAGSTNSSSGFNAQITFAGEYGSSSSGQTPLISWPFIPEQAYSVQFKDDLTDPVWHTLNVPVTFIGSQAYLNDPTNSPMRFYRIVQGN